MKHKGINDVKSITPSTFLLSQHTDASWPVVTTGSSYTPQTYVFWHYNPSVYTPSSISYSRSTVAIYNDRTDRYQAHNITEFVHYSASGFQPQSIYNNDVSSGAFCIGRTKASSYKKQSINYYTYTKQVVEKDHFTALTV